MILVGVYLIANNQSMNEERSNWTQDTNENQLSIISNNNAFNNLAS